MSAIFNQVTIIGVGLIGGSFGMAIKKDGLANRVIGVDVVPGNLDLAVELQAIDQGYVEFNDEASQADLVILAAPITTNEAILRIIKSRLQPGTVVTDVGSTKADFVYASEQILGDDCYFVGGHPMAGSETAGVKGADPYLFENAIYVLTPTTHTDDQTLERVKHLTNAVGSRVMVMDPHEHDLLVAAVSHLPHLIASTLVNAVATIEEQHPLALLLAAGGFRDTTRIASGNPVLWKDICFSNKEQLLKMVGVFQESLQTFKNQLQNKQELDFENNLALAKDVRSKIPAKLKGYWPFLDEIIVMIPDKPGTIGQVAIILGEQGVNIDDIEILKVREGEGGSLRLGFASLGAAEQAIRILGDHGLMARAR